MLVNTSRTRFTKCPACGREAAYDVVRSVCTVISCELYPYSSPFRGDA